MNRDRNDSNAMWRAARTDARRSRTDAESRFTGELKRVLDAGSLRGREFAAGHWRIWNPANPEVALDYWPRTGTLIQANVRLSAHGLRSALRLLRVRA
jgi:hypothetical protein